MFLCATVHNTIQANCSSGYFYFYYQCVQVLPVSSSWQAAQDECASHGNGSSLATIASLAQTRWTYELLRSMGALTSSSSVWLGLNDLAAEGSYVWASGKSTSNRNWAALEPDDGSGGEDCVAMTAASLGLWSDEACSSSRKGLCNLNVLEQPVPSPAPPGNSSFACAPNFDSIHGNCYQYSTISSNWIDAELACESQGAQLASFDSLSEYEAVMEYYYGSGGRSTIITWIGLTDIAEEGSFVWVDGSTSTFRNWDRRQPDNTKGAEHCTFIWDTTDRKWNDAPCYLLYYSLCKLSPSPLSIQQSK